MPEIGYKTKYFQIHKHTDKLTETSKNRAAFFLLTAVKTNDETTFGDQFKDSRTHCLFRSLFAQLGAFLTQNPERKVAQYFTEVTRRNNGRDISRLEATP